MITNKILIVVLLLPLLCNASVIKKPTEKDCLQCTAIIVSGRCTEENAIKYMLWREAANQEEHVQILVLRVLENRVKKFKTDYCTELFRKGAYPYMKYGIKSVPKKFIERYNNVRKSKKLKGVKYIYFNHVPHSFGKKTKKIGGLYFSE